MLIDWTRPALRDMRQVGDAKTRERIVEAIERFASTGHGDVRALRGVPGEYRLRVGNMRVRFTISHRETIRIMLVLHVLPRGGAYD